MGRALEEQWTLTASHSLSFDARLACCSTANGPGATAGVCPEGLDRRRGRALDERLIATLASRLAVDHRHGWIRSQCPMTSTTKRAG
jgi:hypothetical protein